MKTMHDRDRARALLGTMIFHGVLVLCFLFFGLSAPLPFPEEHGVIVALGYEIEGEGQVQPLSEDAQAESVIQPTITNQQPEGVVTQDTYESITLPDEAPDNDIGQEEPDPDPRDQLTEPEEDVVKTVEEEPQQVNPNALFPGRDQHTTNRQDRGETDEPGVQGTPEGVIGVDEYEGLGESNGIEYSLSGRNARHLPLPEYTTLATGRVVVRITVNRQGQVISAVAGASGSTTMDAALRRSAEDAALKTLFDPKPDSPVEQTGTITYNFLRLN